MSEVTRIFVSHSHGDNAWCRAFVAALRARGADVWYDEQNLGFGTLRSKIEHEMQLRPVFITVFSPASVVSKWVGREMDAAIYLQDKQPERVILPVVAAKCDIPPLWVSFKRISGPDDGALAPEAAAAEVARALAIVTPSPAPAGAVQPEDTTATRDDATPLPSAAIFEHAVTDLYDRERGRPLVHYPLWLVLALAVTGFAALLVTGLLGYRDPREDATTAAVFHGPWPLYLWLCALLVVLECSVLRHPTLRHARVAVIVVTVVGTLLTSVLYFYDAIVVNLFNVLASATRLNMPEPSWVDAARRYLLLNFGLLAVYFAYQIRLWIRGARGLPLRGTRGDAAPDEMGAVERSRTDANPSLYELVAGSLLGGAILAAVLGVLLQPAVINTISGLLGASTDVNACELMLPLTTQCNALAGPLGGPTLTYVDLVLALVLLALALLVIGLVVAAQGMASTSEAFAARARVLTRVVYQVGFALRTFFDFRVLTFNVTRLLRFVTWPLLIVLADVALAGCARGVQTHLHLLSDQMTCSSAATCGDPNYYSAVRYEITGGQMYTSAANAILVGILAAVAVTLALALLLYRAVVAKNTLRYLAVLALHTLLLLWLVAAALALVNAVLLLAGITFRRPFVALDPVTLLSFALATAAGQALLLRRIKTYYRGAH